MGAQWLRVRARLQVSNDYPGRKMIQFSGNGAQSEINPLIMAGRWGEGWAPHIGEGHVLSTGHGQGMNPTMPPMISFSLPETIPPPSCIFLLNIRPRLDHFGVWGKEGERTLSLLCLFIVMYSWVIYLPHAENTHRDRESSFPWEESCASYLGTYKSYNAQAFCS